MVLNSEALHIVYDAVKNDKYLNEIDRLFAIAISSVLSVLDALNIPS